MTSSPSNNNTAQRRSPKFLRVWLVGLLGLLLAASYWYYQYRQSQENFININYFRVLSEAATKLNENVSQLISLHKFQESEATIRALLSSYQRFKTEGSAAKEAVCQAAFAKSNSEQTGLGYYFDGQQFIVKTQPASEQSGSYCATVDALDLLPSPKAGFSLYLFVGKNNKVISSTGNQSALSIVNVSHISRLIAKAQNLDWLSLTSKEDGKDPASTTGLPGYSHHIDLQLTSSDYRLFLYPFHLDNRIDIAHADDVPLYMIGVLPKSILDAQENQRWNLSILSITLVLLVFAWMMSRLFMLSSNQPVGDLFYKCTMFCSYLLFVMIIATLIAYGERNLEQRYKNQQAARLLDRLNKDLDQELSLVFKQLDDYHYYYLNKLNAAENPGSPQNSTKEKMDPLQKQQVSPLIPFSQPSQKQHAVKIGAYATEEGSFLIQPDSVNNQNQKKHANSLPGLIDIFASGVQLIPDDKFAQWFNPDAGFDASNRILDVLLLDQNGADIMPMFFAIETNKIPTTYNLAHREYFKKVQSQRGWIAQFGKLQPDMAPYCTPSPVRNFYIQRLRNINNGNRGTTLSVPLKRYSTSSGVTHSAAQRYFLAADIELASLTMTEWLKKNELMDMSIMVIDRKNGDVLFHVDDDRTLIENLFTVGQGTEDISHVIRAGLDKQQGSTPSWVDGFYHGVAGRFTSQKMVIDQWALVLFMPDESLDTYMTNLFLFNTTSMASVILFIAIFIVFLRKFYDTGVIKQKQNIPLVIERRKVVVFSSVFVASAYLSFWLGSSIDRASKYPIYADIGLPIIAAILCLWWGYSEYKRFYLRSRQAQRSPINIRPGAIKLIMLYALGGILMNTYLNQVGMVSSAALQWYYQQKLYPARLNQERQEIHKMAMNRYPNSISRYQVDPLRLMPISPQWAKKLARHSPDQTLPKDVLHFSRLVNTTDAADWVSRYLLSAPHSERDLQRPGHFGHYLLSMFLAFVLICFIWVAFNRRILSVRLFGPPQFLRHINQIVDHHQEQETYRPDSNLLIDFVTPPPAGHSLEFLLEQWKTQSAYLPEHFELLFSLCPLLSELIQYKSNEQNDFFPNVKILLNTEQNKMHLKLWDIEVSLEQHRQRALILQLINHLKSLHSAEHIASVTIYSGFHSLQRLCLKDTLLSAEWFNRQQLERNEYFSWAECLMDFSVTVPQTLQQHLDPDFIRHEIDAFPMLEFLRDELPAMDNQVTAEPFNLTRWINLQDWQKSHHEWASINYILLKAEALYRFKWESCSAAEKLALFYLVQNKRVNPANVQMLEHLALSGLIKIKRGRIHIVNKSFAYFVRYAEDKETLKRLIDKGDVGTWQDYKMPVTLLILLVIGAIALTSGNSLYMIVASVMGVLGTIGSLTNSASLIRDNLNK